MLTEHHQVEQGPSSAQSGTYYVFTETSNNTTWGGQIWLECRYDFSTLSDASLDFWYHKYSSNGGGNGPGILSLDVFDGATWTYDVFRDDLTNADAWKNANVDLSIYAGRPDVRLSWTVWVETTGWQCDIALDNIVVDGTGGGGGGPPTCATLPYEQDFETGHDRDDWDYRFTITNRYRCNISKCKSLWTTFGRKQAQYKLEFTQYTTGALAFANSPAHIATASREICASTDPSLELTFNILQQYTYNA